MDVTADPMIVLDNVRKEYPNGTVAVDSLSLEVKRGEICALVGPSGCGKTTSMRMINRLVEPSGGRIHVAGEDVTDVDPVSLRREIGYVIQQVGLFPHRTVRRNVGTVCWLLGWDKADIEPRVDEMMQLVGLDPDELGDRYPHELSGGQRQRVGVARGLAARPPVLLMDEPFGAVDPLARDRLQEEFLSLQRELGTTVVLVTHDIEEAVRLGDRIAVLSQGGHLEQYDSPVAVLGAPANDFVAGFVGSDRLMKMMAVTPVIDALLTEPGPDAASLPQIPNTVMLREATVELLQSDAGRVRVIDDSGSVKGELSLDGIRRILAEPRQAA